MNPKKLTEKQLESLITQFELQHDDYVKQKKWGEATEALKTANTLAFELTSRQLMKTL